MPAYQPFNKSEFEKLLNDLEESYGLFKWHECSDKLNKQNGSDGLITNEFVYRFYLERSRASFLIFSSIDKNTEITRNVGNDAVRIVMVWTVDKDKNEEVYYKVCNHNRTENLFNNLTETLINNAKKRHSLNKINWVSKLPA